MRKLFRILLFLLPVILFIGWWEYGLNTITNSYSLKHSQLEAQAGQLQVLVLGPSHALRGVNPDCFCMKGYNAANIQQSLFYDTRIAQMYLDKMPHLKVMLIDISYPSLWFEIYSIKDSWRDYFYATDWGIRYPKVKWYDIHLYSRILQYGNDKAWQFALHGFDVPITKNYCNNGWAPLDIQGQINDSAANNQLENRKYFTNGNLLNSIKDLRTLLTELNKRKIVPAFFSPPVSSYYLRNVNKDRVKVTDSVLNVLCHEFTCKRYNYMGDTRFNDTDFRDVSHLNPAGAVKFSRILNEEILKQYCPAVTSSP